MSFLPTFRRELSKSRYIRPKQLPIGRPTTSPTSIISVRPAWLVTPRMYATDSLNQVEPPDYLSEGERKVFDMVKEGLQPIRLEVQDISGGCGSMYALEIVSEQFKGLPIIKQHRLVNQVLGEEIKKWHGVQLKTKAPDG